MKRILQKFTTVFTTSKYVAMPLGRWCRPDTNVWCDPVKKHDLANADNCAGPSALTRATKVLPTDDERYKKDSINVFSDGFGF